MENQMDRDVERDMEGSLVIEGFFNANINVLHPT